MQGEPVTSGGKDSDLLGEEAQGSLCEPSEESFKVRKPQDKGHEPQVIGPLRAAEVCSG